MRYENKQKLCKMIQDYYKDHCTGGNLHIVLDDGNLSNRHIEYCVNSIRSDNINDQTGLDIAKMLLELSFSKRNRLYNNRWRC